jgi:hypothetical protein
MPVPLHERAHRPATSRVRRRRAGHLNVRAFSR